EIQDLTAGESLNTMKRVSSQLALPTIARITIRTSHRLRNVTGYQMNKQILFLTLLLALGLTAACKDSTTSSVNATSSPSPGPTVGAAEAEAQFQLFGDLDNSM